MASDEDSDEDFVTYGTPLEPLDEDESTRKPIPLHEQTVKDEKGRYQRFHGAFTGGFSAGYFNTVGSKEGWTPSTFVSSRQQKADRQNARPEDFMDEEDLGEHGIAPQEIVTTDNFASERRDKLKDKARAVSSLAAPIPGDTALLEELIAPARSSIGVHLLRKMGWKDGQGVGPRLKRKPSKQNTERVYECVLPPKGSEESEDDDDEFAPENVTFAPKDVIPVDFTPKVDSHGLGYRGLDPFQALSGGSETGHINLFTLHSDRTTSLFGDKKSKQQRRGGIAGQAFGVGAMEEEDDDIYHKDSMTNYDTVLGGEDPGDGLYGWTAPQQYTKKKNDSNQNAAYLGKILEGFTLASKVTEMKTVYPPPDLPRDYRPVHYFRPVVDSSSVSPIVAQALQASRGHLSQEAPQQGRHTLDSAQRCEMLGETPLQGPSSVFELLSSKDRERLSGMRKVAEERSKPERNLTSAVDRAVVVASAKAAALQALSSRFQSVASQSDSPNQSLPSSEMQMALNAWSGPTADASKTFKPFAKNPQKQARYDLYINKLKHGDKDAVESSLDSSMTEWERGRERDEFVRAALLYKPSNSSLSSRFTRSKHEDDTDSVEVTRDQENDVDDKQAAVKMKMFGKLTRDTFDWHPDKLLCKRFNVPDPYPGSSIKGMPKIKRDKYSVFNFLTLTDSSQVSREAPSAPKPQSTSATLPISAPDISNKRSRWDVPGQVSKPKDPLSAFLSEARSEVSVAQQVEAGVKTSTDPPNTTAAPEVKEAQSDGQQKTEEDEEEEDEEEVRPPMDLFKAIFASSSDEKSSSSSEDDSEGEEKVTPPKSEPIKSSAGTLSTTISAQITPVPDISKVAGKILELRSHNFIIINLLLTLFTRFTVQSMLPAETAAQNAQSSVNPPAKTGDLDEEEFGPRLPPPGLVPPAHSPQLKKKKKKDKEKHKAKKDHKHKKEKKKKKNKKHKHKGKQKKKVEESNSSSEDSDSNGEDESSIVSTSELLQRLKNLRDKR
ncbi:G patch domain-containing protein 1-like isoform X1 [Myxocyprinus asiaticus]|uniref:G patch domain-containing protein 1-like isoform X1 n=1 Tax=Myxocyprinus asiaticus TaxID=70543 RepID=UPI00222176A9|nr:G patch domain-containing protein 1-like isoform X1 [Myxocyprinus asiaticus]